MLQTIDGLIPSLFTFFEDVKYLQMCAESMTHLVEPGLKQTMRSALDDSFADLDQHVIQQTESSFTVQPSQGLGSWYSAYRQLWLGIMRHYPNIPAAPKKKKALLAKAETVKADGALLSELAAGAYQLGFRSAQITELMEGSSDREIARDALLKARKPGSYEYHDHILQTHIEQIVALFASAQPVKTDQMCPMLISDDPGASAIRCGFPNKEEHARDKGFLFITNLHVETGEQGASITSFFVRTSVYFAFFGRPAEDGSYFTSPRDAATEPAASVPSREPHSNAATVEFIPELQRQTSLGNGSHGHEQGDSSRDQRRGTQVDLEMIIENGLASIREEPEGLSRESQAVGNLEELVSAYRDLVRADSLEHPFSEIRIEFMIYDRDAWRTDRSLLVNSAEPSKVERVAKKYMRKGFRPFDSSFNPLVPRTCFQAVTADGTNTILLNPEHDIRINNQLLLPGPVSDAGPSTSKRAKKILQ